MVFVTGATGLVGARLVFDLYERGYQITALRRKNTPSEKLTSLLKYYTNNAEQITASVNWVEGDLCDFEVLYEQIKAEMEVYHCAARVSFNPKFKQKLNETNVEGTANLVNVCLEKKVKKFCHVSSIGALGSPVNGDETDTETPWNPISKSAYSISKHNSELEVWRGIAEGLNAVIVNPAVILGAGNWQSGSPELFSRIAKRMRYYTLGTTGYVYVGDVSKAMILLMESDISGERFILSAENMSYKDLFEQIAHCLQVVPPKIQATPFITNLAWRFEKVRTLLFGGEPKLTRDTHKTAHSLSYYNGKPITTKIFFAYTSINDAVEQVALQYKSKH